MRESSLLSFANSFQSISPENALETFRMRIETNAKTVEWNEYARRSSAST